MSQSLIIKKSSSNVTLVRSGASAASGLYTLPPATNATLGGIIVGDNLTVTANGVLSGVNSYTLPEATNSTLGGVIVGSGVSVNNGTISVNTNYLNNSTTNSTYSYSESSISGFNYAALTLTATGANSTNSVRNDWLANTGKFGNIQWILKPNTGIYNWTWGGIGLDANTTDATRPEMSLSTNYSLNFGAGEAYGRGIGISPRDVYLKETYFSGPALPAKEWTDNSFLIKSYADGRYLLTANFTYANLTGTPTLSAVATSGAYSDLTGTPDLSVYLTTSTASSTYQPIGNYTTSADLTWSNLTGKPTFATVATSGSYTDLANTPNLSLYYLANNPTGYITAACLTYGNITGTPNLSLYLTTANAASTYLPSANFTYSNLTGKPTTLAGYGITDGLTSATAASTYQTISGMSSYLTISSAASTYLPAANFTYSNITGKPTLATVATSGNYNDLSNKPASYTLPAATNTTLGGIIVGANLSVSANGTLSANIPAGGGGFANGDILNGGTF